MFVCPNIFENSLRGRNSVPIETKDAKNHAGCKGSYHGQGNYNPKEKNQTSPFIRNGSLRSSRRSEKSKKVDQKSTNSEGASESDSLDSVKNYDTVSDGKAKSNREACNRLFSNPTKASEAKMRHLDIFDVQDVTWESALRKSKSFKPIKRNESQDTNSYFSRSLNGSFRRTSRRSSDSKSKEIDWERVYFEASIRKHVGFFQSLDEKNCFKYYLDGSKMVREIIN